MGDIATNRSEQDARLLEAVGIARNLEWVGSERGLAEELGLAPSIFYKVRNKVQSFPKEGLFALEVLLGLNPDFVRTGVEPRFAFPHRSRQEKRAVYERVRMAAIIEDRDAEQIRQAMSFTAVRWKQLKAGSDGQIPGLAQALGRAFPTLSIPWLLIGVGRPTTEFSPAKEIAHASVPGATVPVVMNLPFVDVRAKAGFAASFLQGIQPDHLPLRPIVSQPEDRIPPEAVLIEVEGDSMAPTLMPKDVLLIAPVPTTEWKYVSGGIYVVLFGSEHLVVKRILRNGLSTEGRLTLSSDNPTGGEIELHGSDIGGIFKVLSVTRSL